MVKLNKTVLCCDFSKSHLAFCKTLFLFFWEENLVHQKANIQLNGCGEAYPGTVGVWLKYELWHMANRLCISKYIYKSMISLYAYF